MPQANTAYYGISLSNTAYDGLARLGVEHNYVRPNVDPNTTPSRGVGLFMMALLDANAHHLDWEDTRPEHMRSALAEELSNGRFGEWDTGEIRRLRSVRYSPQYRELAASLAQRLGVVRQHPNVGPSRAMGEASLNSEFWEAVGLKWLTPTKPPKASLRVRRPVPYEMDW